MSPLRGEKKMLPPISSLSTEAPMLRPRKAIVVYNERQLQVRANDERKSINSSTSLINSDGNVTNYNSDKKSFNCKRRSSTASIIETKVKMN